MLTICHLSAVAARLDARSFHRESVPMRRSGVNVTYVGPHGLNTIRDDIRVVSTPVRHNRMARMLLSPLILRAALRSRADIYHLHDPELIPAGFLLKFLFHRRVVYDACEDFPTMMLNKQYIPEPIRRAVSGLVLAVERCAARCLDGIITADPFTMRRLAPFCGSHKLVFLNFPDLTFFPHQEHPKKEYDVVYRGGLSERTGTSVLIEALRLLRQRGAKTRTLLLGYYDNKTGERALREQIHTARLTEFIELRGRIPLEEMATVIASARIGVCPLRPIPKFLLNIPVKVWEYWACSLPVIATDLPPVRLFFRDGQYGRLVPPDDAVRLADAIEELLSAPERAAAMGEKGRQVVLERFNNANEVRKLLRMYRRVAGAEA